MNTSKPLAARLIPPVALLFAALLPISRAAADTFISPDDPALYYVGRFDHRDPAGPRFEWSASSVTIRFRGPAITVKLRDTGNDEYEIILDGKALSFHARAGGQSLALHTLPSPPDHLLQVVKRTEAFVGRGQITGVVVPTGTELLPAQPLSRRIEIIGDSISCGYGNEAKDQHEHFSPQTENAYQAYGDIVARAVNAEYTCIAWSGKKMWPDNTIPAIYDLTLPTDPTSTWPFTAPPPDVVLINLATNDFSPNNPDQAQWCQAYETFVRRVRTHYPHALIYLAAGTMMSDAFPPGHNAMTTLRQYLQQIQDDLKSTGETNVKLIDFGTQDGQADGLGADYHPSLKTDQKMADKFVASMQADLGWKPVTTQP